MPRERSTSYEESLQELQQRNTGRYAENSNDSGTSRPGTARSAVGERGDPWTQDAHDRRRLVAADLVAGGPESAPNEELSPYRGRSSCYGLTVAGHPRRRPHAAQGAALHRRGGDHARPRDRGQRGGL